MVKRIGFSGLFAFGFASKGRLVLMPMVLILERFVNHPRLAENRDYQMVNQRSRPMP